MSFSTNYVGLPTAIQGTVAGVQIDDRGIASLTVQDATGETYQLTPTLAIQPIPAVGAPITFIPIKATIYAGSALFVSQP